MKTVQNIRKSVFETNSSSTHSIIISDNTDYDTIQPNEDGEIVLGYLEFGWEIREYYDALTKAHYCAIDAQGNDEKTKMLKEVLMEQTGARNIVINVTGYIDHQSYNTTDPAFSSKENLRNFIFSKESVLFTDNDNH